MASVSKPEEIDRFAEERGWFHPKWNGNLYKMIQAYLSGELDLSAVVPRTADPIDQHYSTADGGRAIHNAEKLAEDQRPYYDVVKAEEMWGVPLRPDELPPPSSTRTTRSWIMVLGKKLYDLAADETSGNSKGEDFVGCGPLWEAHRDKRIPSRKRWRFWKERLRIIRDKETLSQETRDAAAEAFRKIEEIENFA